MKGSGSGNGHAVVEGLSEGERSHCLLSSGSQVRVLPGAPNLM